MRIGAALIAGLAVALPASAEGDAWHLQKIVVANHLDPNIEVWHHYADAVRGEVGLTVNGELLGKCPGGNDSVSVDWDLPDVAELSEGGTIAVTIGISGGELNQPCTGAFAQGSTVALADADAAPDALAAETMKAVDRKRFQVAGAGALTLPANETSARAPRRMTLSAAPGDPSRPYAYFQIRISVSGSERGMNIVYVYSREPAPIVPPSAGDPLPPPG